MNEKFNIYLAVPGTQTCWGTVTGLINSTARHTAHPRQHGMGFSGVEDFNICWAEAHNWYDKGLITHFAMLHADITPDPEQRWLDILMEELIGRNASLVSAVSPIKDLRGITSSGICDLDDPWKPYRRFTIREIHQALPETFDNAAAGYPDRPLLHNTGMWVCDLRRPCFQAVNALGELDLNFRFPDSCVRDPISKEWIHRRESEDWLFSRELWLRGVRDTFITRRPRLTHHGKADFTNARPWGQFLDGDENTADKWRAALDALPLRTLQILQFELGSACNLAGGHTDCPSSHPERYADLDTSRKLDDDTIANSAIEAYRSLGFTGLVSFMYYNEPLVEADRMFALMARIKAGAPAARFLLWTNGTLIPEDCERFRQFEQIIVSGYNDMSLRGCDHLRAAGISAKVIENPKLDTRLIDLEPVDRDAPCLRPFVELIVDHHGNTHLCCYDWRGRGTWGNLLDVPIAELAKRWRAMLPAIAGEQMTAEAPAACRSCGYRWQKYQQHDAVIVERARKLRLNEEFVSRSKEEESKCPTS